MAILKHSINDNKHKVCKLSSTAWGYIYGDIEKQKDLIEYIKTHGGGGGTGDYNDLDNKPKLNGTELVGDTKVKTVFGYDLVGDGNIPPEIFYIEYGSEITQEIKDALNNGKLIVCVYENRAYTLLFFNAYIIAFVNIIPDSDNILYELIFYNATNDSWSKEGLLIPTKESVQEKLVSGTNIKTINSQSLLGSGNIEIQGGGTEDYNDLENKPKLNNVELKNEVSLTDINVYSKTEADTKFVEKESGKVLSSNDYTDVEKSKLAGIQEGAQQNNLFFVTYGQTKFEDIKNAILAYKHIVCFYGNRVYTLKQYSSTNIFLQGVMGDINYGIAVTSANVWSFAAVSFENKVNKSTTISSSSTDAEYPSSKAVYTAVNDKYTKPSNGIPSTDLTQGVQNTLNSVSGKSNWEATTEAPEEGEIVLFLQSNYYVALTAVPMTTISLSSLVPQYNEPNPYYHFSFWSGETPTTLFLPEAIKMPSNFEIKANKIYEIIIMDNKGVYAEWDV